MHHSANHKIADEIAQGEEAFWHPHTTIKGTRL
jgi:hypothetical protein